MHQHIEEAIFYTKLLDFVTFNDPASLKAMMAFVLPYKGNLVREIF